MASWERKTSTRRPFQLSWHHPLNSDPLAQNLAQPRELPLRARIVPPLPSAMFVTRSPQATPVSALPWHDARVTAPSVSTTDLDSLPPVWDALRHRYGELEIAEERYRTDPTLLSQRRLDESQVAGPRTYMTAAGLLVAAQDNQAVLEKVVHQIGITSHAPWNLIRPAFETAFHALWILDPIEGLARRRRGLRIELADHRERRNWVQAIQATGLTTPEMDDRLAARNDEVLATYSKEAEYFGSKIRDLNRLPNLVEEIPRLRTLARLDAGIRYSLVATWRQLSGLQHGHTYALMGVSDKSHLVKIPGGVQMTVTANDHVFVTAAKSAAMIQLHALRRLIDLTTLPPHSNH